MMETFHFIKSVLNKDIGNDEYAMYLVTTSFAICTKGMGICEHAGSHKSGPLGLVLALKCEKKIFFFLFVKGTKLKFQDQLRGGQ